MDAAFKVEDHEFEGMGSMVCCNNLKKPRRSAEGLEEGLGP
jgi:hypothetical protein